MAFWSKPQTKLLTPEIVAPISTALADIPHTFDWSVYDKDIEGEQIIFAGEHAKIHILANSRDCNAAANIMLPSTDCFELSAKVIPLEMLLDYNDRHWEDYKRCFANQAQTMLLYGDIVTKYAMPFFQGVANFELLTAFHKGFLTAYTGHFSGRFN